MDDAVAGDSGDGFFNHSPIISSFAVAKREEYGEGAEKKYVKFWPRPHHDGADRNVLRLQLRAEPDAGRSGGGKRAEHLYSVLPGEPLNAPIIAPMAPDHAMIAASPNPRPPPGA